MDQVGRANGRDGVFFAACARLACPLTGKGELVAPSPESCKHGRAPAPACDPGPDLRRTQTPVLVPTGSSMGLVAKCEDLNLCPTWAGKEAVPRCCKRFA